jgi:hypothetical protein
MTLGGYEIVRFVTINTEIWRDKLVLTARPRTGNLSCAVFTSLKRLWYVKYERTSHKGCGGSPIVACTRFCFLLPCVFSVAVWYPHSKNNQISSFLMKKYELPNDVWRLIQNNNNSSACHTEENALFVTFHSNDLKYFCMHRNIRWLTIHRSAQNMQGSL